MKVGGILETALSVADQGVAKRWLEAFLPHYLDWARPT
jgi:hypothetical protein